MIHQFTTFFTLLVLGLGSALGCKPGTDSQEQKINVEAISCNPDRPEIECKSIENTNDRSTLVTYTDILNASLPTPADSNGQTFGLTASPSAEDKAKSQADETKAQLKKKLALKSAKYREDFHRANSFLITTVGKMIQAIDDQNKKALCFNSNAVVGKLKEMDQLFEEYNDDRLAFIYVKIYLTAARIVDSSTCTSR